MKQPSGSGTKTYMIMNVIAGLLLFCTGALLQASHRPPTPEAGSASAKTAGIVPLGPEGVRGPRGKSEIALTFDGGAEAECFADLIAALAKAHANSTFFIIGRFTRSLPEC